MVLWKCEEIVFKTQMVVKTRTQNTSTDGLTPSRVPIFVLRPSANPALPPPQQQKAADSFQIW